MKIVYIVPLLAPYAVTRFRELAKIDDVELHVIVEKDTDRERVGCKFQQIDGVATYLLKVKEYKYIVKHKKSGYSINNDRMFSFGLRKLVRQIDPDFVIVCNSTQILFLLGPRKYTLGVVVEDTLRAEEGRNMLSRLAKRVLLKMADFYLPFSNDAMKYLAKNGIKKNMYSSSWSVNDDFFSDLKNPKDREHEKQKLNLKNKVNYLIVSALIPLKGLVKFLLAWNKMPEEFQNCSELNILGEGPLRKYLEQLARANPYNNVHLKGHRPYKEVSHFMQCSDIFVLPTLQDLCSLAVFEALASGLPVMTTIYNGAKDLVYEGVNGYLFDSENEKSIINSLSQIRMADLNAMSRASEQIISEFTDEKVMKRLARILHEINIGKNPSFTKKNCTLQNCSEE